jgi:spore coat protein U-like protein
MVSIVLGLVAGLATSLAQAASVASCSATSVPISYGAYDPTSSTALTPTGSISVTCNLISGISLLVAYTISLSAGSSGSVAARHMIGTSTPMSYNLYLDGGWVTVWGDGTGGSQTKSDGYLLALNTTLTYTVYSKLPARQLVAAGSYSDNVMITISY